jgi:hypothetical protein
MSAAFPDRLGLNHSAWRYNSRMSKETRRTDRQRQREEEPPRPLHPDSTDPRSPEPHHALANPASSPDETEFPDPYERRPDPKGPEAGSEEDEPSPRAPSTSEPHPPRNYDDLKPVKGDHE